MSSLVDLAAVREAAGSVPDPEIRRSIADMDLLDDVTVDDQGQVEVRYHLTSPLCPSRFAVQIGREMRRRVELVEAVTGCRVIIQDHFIATDIAALVNEGSVHDDVPMDGPVHRGAAQREGSAV